MKERQVQAMMIGDGLNDILSLQEANIGVSINAKSELNLLAADVVVLNENLWKVISLLELMRLARYFIILNLFWACLYNVIMLPLAAGALLPWISNLAIPPLWGSAFMSISSIVVVLCSNVMPLVFKRPEEVAK